MVNLAMRKVPMDGLCSVCFKSFETTLHTVWGCTGLKVVRSAYEVASNLGQAPPNPVKWEPPREGLYKLNTYASLDVQSYWVGLGLVITDHSGFVMAANSQKVEKYSPSVVEALAIYWGLKFVVDSGLVHVIVESDALKLVNYINSDLAVWSDCDRYSGYSSQFIRVSSCFRF
ncbi:hypothetical protein Ddye_026407 [Dipteronia dyeriana]|uniref:RNase H type-1 domain-containing protein n=1 Tax=Dipteronia dyeriana TaxID=168575 RepID=A0AAD9WQD2_9ROSI|nr:hypothetical protein Ddye_026407 [Dipteronia dyeriana]